MTGAIKRTDEGGYTYEYDTGRVGTVTCKKCGTGGLTWVKQTGPERRMPTAGGEREVRWTLATKVGETRYDMEYHQPDDCRDAIEIREQREVAAKFTVRFKIGDRVIHEPTGTTGTVERVWYPKEPQFKIWWDGKRYQKQLKWTAGEQVLRIKYDTPEDQKRYAGWQRALKYKVLAA